MFSIFLFPHLQILKDACLESSFIIYIWLASALFKAVSPLSEIELTPSPLPSNLKLHSLTIAFPFSVLSFAIPLVTLCHILYFAYSLNCMGPIIHGYFSVNIYSTTQSMVGWVLGYGGFGGPTIGLKHSQILVTGWSWNQSPVGQLYLDLLPVSHSRIKLRTRFLSFFFADCYVPKIYNSAQQIIYTWSKVHEEINILKLLI